MRMPVLIVAASFALAACSSTGAKKLAVCDGKHLRPGCVVYYWTQIH